MIKKRNLGLIRKDAEVIVGPYKLLNCSTPECDALRAITDIGKHYYRAIVVFVRDDKYIWAELETLALLRCHPGVYILPQLKLDGSTEDLLCQVDDYLDPKKKFASHVLIDLVNKEIENAKSGRKENLCQ